MMRFIFLVLCTCTILLGCKKKRSPKPPEAVQLIFPEQNSECTTGISLGQEKSQVEFDWSAADNTETYELRVTNTNTGTVQTIVSSNTTASLPLEKGGQFSWLVRSRNSQIEESVSSEIWSFYNAGSRTTFAPFPAEIISPTSSENVFKDINNEVTLSWATADLDNDIISCEVYFSVETPPTDLIRTVPPSISSIKVSVTSDTVYYWSVVVIDSEGNKSNSGVFNFKVL